MSEGFENGTPQYYGEPQQNNDNKGLAIASMVVGIVSILASCWKPLIGLIAGIVAIVLAVMHNKNNSKNGMATAGLVCGIVAIVLSVIIFVIAALGLAIFGAALAEMGGF